MLQEKITDIFFDLDHTLWDFDRNSELAFDRIFRENHPQINTKQFVEIYAPINQACWKLYQVDKISHDELRYKRLKDSFDALSYSISDDEIYQMAVDYITFLPENNILFEELFEKSVFLKNKNKVFAFPNLYLIL